MYMYTEGISACEVKLHWQELTFKPNIFSTDFTFQTYTGHILQHLLVIRGVFNHPLRINFIRSASIQYNHNTCMLSERRTHTYSNQQWLNNVDALHWWKTDSQVHVSGCLCCENAGVSNSLLLLNHQGRKLVNKVIMIERLPNRYSIPNPLA